MNSTPRVLVLAFLLSASSTTKASAQGFNIDLGDNLILFPAPSASYGAAAGQSGAWNVLSYPYQSLSLVGLDGTPTAATAQASPGAGAYNNFMTTLAGDDERLMEDQLWVPNLGAVISVTIEGLVPGAYDVYTYAWDESGATTSVDVVGSTDGAQVVGGLWSGSPHVQGVTFARHALTSPAGIIEIQAQGVAFLESGGLNGVQIVPADGGLGTSYCTSTPSSTGSPALIFGTGSTGVAANLFVLNAAPVPSQPAIFFYGASQVLVPFGNGFRCVGGQVARLGVTLPVSGVLSWNLDFTSPPTPAAQITPGSTWNFQAWFRDPAGGGAAFNLSNGLEVAFTP